MKIIFASAVIICVVVGMCVIIYSEYQLEKKSKEALDFIRSVCIQKIRQNTCKKELWSVAEYYNRIEQESIEIAKDREKRTSTPFILWWGLDGLKMANDGTFEWIRKDVEQKQFDEIPKPSLGSLEASEKFQHSYHGGVISYDKIKQMTYKERIEFLKNYPETYARIMQEGQEKEVALHNSRIQIKIPPVYYTHLPAQMHYGCNQFNYQISPQQSIIQPTAVTEAIKNILAQAEIQRLEAKIQELQEQERLSVAQSMQNEIIMNMLVSERDMDGRIKRQ